MSESPFLSEGEYNKMISTWRKDVAREEDEVEDRRIPYIMGRHLDAGNKDFDLNNLHGINFIEHIEKKIEETGANRRNPLMILDLGGGMHFFSDQLRAKFGSKVKVVSTGISADVSQKARDIVASANTELPHVGAIPKELHPDDSKMHSIFQMNKTEEGGAPKEEFDLIVDTFGEQYYGLEGKSGKLEKFLEAILAKLKSGGMATIAPFGSFARHEGQKIRESDYSSNEVHSILERLKDKCDIEKINKGNGQFVLRIIKK